MGEERFEQALRELMHESLKVQAIEGGDPDVRTDADPMKELTNALVGICHDRFGIAKQHGFEVFQHFVYAVMAALVEEIKVPSNRTLRAKYIRNAIKRVAIRVSGGKE